MQDGFYQKLPPTKYDLGLLHQSPGEITIHYVKRTQEHVTKPIIGERTESISIGWDEFKILTQVTQNLNK